MARGFWVLLGFGLEEEEVRTEKLEVTSTAEVEETESGNKDDGFEYREDFEEEVVEEGQLQLQAFPP